MDPFTFIHDLHAFIARQQTSLHFASLLLRCCEGSFTLEPLKEDMKLRKACKCVCIRLFYGRKSYTGVDKPAAGTDSAAVDWRHGNIWRTQTAFFTLFSFYTVGELFIMKHNQHGLWCRQMRRKGIICLIRPH